MSNKILYIGLNGFAGSGKDTVAKALRLMLSYDWNSYEEFRTTWEREAFKMNYATFGMSPEDDICFCIAFADQLKHICSEMFGIPIESFYYKKETAWVDISGTFEYTEKRPYDGDLITAEDYYYSINSNNVISQPTWMSLREILVYVGTYICQQYVNRNCFINGIANKIKQIQARNKNLQYVICTDVRFYHEMQFIKNMHGININITRNGVQQLDNIAEHDLDYEDGFDFIINNDGTYDELLVTLWNLVHNNDIFKNITYQLPSHDMTVNCLRKLSDNKWYCCFENNILRTGHENGKIISIDPSGGPMLSVGMHLEGIGIISSIEFTDDYGYVLNINCA